MADISKKAGVSKGLLYNYFEGKESILLAILKEAMDQGEQIMQIEEKVPARQHLKNIIQRFFESSSAGIAFYRMIFPIAFQVHKFPFLQELIEEKRELFIGDTINIFKELGYEDPVQAAWELAAITDGIMIHMIHLEDKYPGKKMENFLMKKYNLE
jgi:AcrR family transcriptional regulator